jgi:hypothetical protein
VALLDDIPTQKLAIIVSTMIAVAWILKPGPIALVISIVGGALLAMRSMSGSAPKDGD